MKNSKRHLLCELFVIGLAIVSASGLSAQNTGGQKAKAVAAEEAGAAVAATHSAVGTANERRVQIGAGDLLELRVFDVPEMMQTVRVNDAGDASFSLIGRVHVGDFTPDEARSVIAHKLIEGNYLVDPQVSVIIQEYGSQGVSVLGEGQKPGVYPVLGNQTLLDVISQAGGTTMYAGDSVTIKHKLDGTLLTIPLT